MLRQQKQHGQGHGTERHGTGGALQAVWEGWRKGKAQGQVMNQPVYDLEESGHPGRGVHSAVRKQKSTAQKRGQ